ncbi:PspA-associated protein PspAA [Propioniciclava soli]|uniref:PspA-associated domain-containing protein n=1 Tax=Propioniciclava soli TaxID=2775081 RepID=A0ABZ3C4N1_9ACTN|nr:hypothetical protein [Propioniciclava soli]
MIVRILGEGQFRLADADLDRINALDDTVEDAARAGDAAGLASALAGLLGSVREQGTPLDDDVLVDSDVILPDAEATPEQIVAWMDENPDFEGLFPGETAGGAGATGDR